MKSPNAGLRFAAVAAAFLMLAACSSTDSTEGANTSPSSSSTIAPGTQEDLVANVGDRVFFDTDKSSLSDEARATLHIENYGNAIEQRLTGLHETCSYKEFRYGVGHRGASIRIPLQVAQAGRGYLEDRRPNANVDPYVVARLLLETICD